MLTSYLCFILAGVRISKNSIHPYLSYFQLHFNPPFIPTHNRQFNSFIVSDISSSNTSHHLPSLDAILLISRLTFLKTLTDSIKICAEQQNNAHIITTAQVYLIKYGTFLIFSLIFLAACSFKIKHQSVH